MRETEAVVLAASFESRRVSRPLFGKAFPLETERNRSDVGLRTVGDRFAARGWSGRPASGWSEADNLFLKNRSSDLACAGHGQFIENVHDLWQFVVRNLTF